MTVTPNDDEQPMEGLDLELDPTLTLEQVGSVELPLPVDEDPQDPSAEESYP